MADSKVSVPNVIGDSLTNAETKITNDKLKYDTPDKGNKGDSSTVKRQSPAAGSQLAEGSTVHLYIEESR